MKKTKSILLVEDDDLLVRMYKTKFEMEGFEVRSAIDGESGLQMALNERIDFIVSYPSPYKGGNRKIKRPRIVPAITNLE